MADPKSRLAIQIAGFANLIPVKGAIITGDGEQTTYLEPGVNGQVLTADDTTPEGVAWQPSGGGGALTASDGVTRTLDNLTNDLVTGVVVDQVNALTSGNGNIQLVASGTGGILLDTTGGGSVAGDGIDILATGGINVTSDTGAVAIASGADQDVGITAGDDVNIQAGGGGPGPQNINLTAPAGAIFGNAQGIQMNTSGGTQLDMSDLTFMINTTDTSGDVTVTSGNNINETAPGIITLSQTGSAPGSGIRIGIIDPGNAGIFVDASGTLSVPVAGNVDLKATNEITALAGLDIGIISTAGNVTAAAPAGGVTLTAGAAFSLTAGTSGLISTSGGNLTIDVNGANDLILTPNRDETHTVGRNFSVVAAGAAGSGVESQNGNLTFQAGTIGGTGTVRLQPGTISATRQFAIFDGGGAGQQTVASASGGVVIDVEARQAVLDIINTMINWGWYQSPP